MWAISGVQDKELVFLFNFQKMESTDNRTLAELKMHHLARIYVIFLEEVIDS